MIAFTTNGAIHDFDPPDDARVQMLGVTTKSRPEPPRPVVIQNSPLAPKQFTLEEIEQAVSAAYAARG